MITILDSPQLVQPVYNPIYVKVESDETAQEAFSFLFDVYVNGQFVNRDKLLPRPGSIQAIYSPARILESYVSYDLSQSYIGDGVSYNCIDKYQIVVGEEYVVYWDYDTIGADTFTSTSYTMLSGTTAHGYSQGDYILIDQNPGFTYAKYTGVHTVVAVLSSTDILININWTGTTPLSEGGTITWADKRKTVFTDVEVLTDGTFQSISNWTQYGPDADLNTIENGTPGYLNWIQRVSGTFLTKYTEAVGVSLTPGVSYDVTYTVFDTYPALGPQVSYVNLGGTSGTTNAGVGTFTETIVCGGGTEFRLFGGSVGSGYQGITFTEVSVILAPIEKYDFNGVIQYEEVPTWDYTEYQMDDNIGKFLTKQPSTVKTTLSERGSISFLNILDHDDTPNAVYYMFVTGIGTDGNSRIPVPFDINNMVTSPTTNNRILHFGAYPWNLNLLSQSVYGIDVIDSTSANYSLTIYRVDDPMIDPYGYIQVSETKTFEVDQCVKKYEPVRFMFLNSLGGFDYYTATLLSRTSINQSKDTFVKTLGLNYVQGDRGRTVINVNAQESTSITTDWITENTAAWLSYEFFNSSEVYILNTDGSIIPITVDNSTVEVKKRVNDSLLNYTFSYTKAVSINTQRN